MRRPRVIPFPLGAFILYILIRSRNPREHYIIIYGTRSCRRPFFTGNNPPAVQVDDER